MNRENFDGVDLFGHPVPKRREGPGRPKKEWTPENSNIINMVFANGGDPKDAAAALGISMPTLRLHYFSELRDWRIASLKLKAALLIQLHEESRKGNVAATKELLKQVERGALVRLSKLVANREGGAKAPAKGKKERQKDAATSYRGKFAPPDGPKLIN